MTGYQPNYKILEKLGVKILDDEFRTPYYDEFTMETNIKGVFLAGVLWSLIILRAGFPGLNNEYLVEASTAGNSLINFGFIAVVIAILTPL